ncbi:hypothetical protein [Burkholderia sp. BCC1047]|uniref:hypothetical protein n=1 Tax=Burkholderia sp. BCC1047 TaxID=2676299 RepID=UPI00158BFF32|nr:hypothetical protein [Burkholderia sp. BCC1047]
MMTTNTYGGYTVDQLREFIRHHYDAEHGGDNIDELTSDRSASVKIVRDLLDAIEPQQDGDLLRPIARWVYNAVRVNLNLLHGICSEFGCQQGEDVAMWLRARLAGVPTPCMCSGVGPCEQRTDGSCRRDRAAVPAQAAEPVAEVSGDCFIVIGHGETDIPEAKIVTRRDDLLDAVLGMMYCPASDAPDDVRAEYAAALADEDEWAADTWSVSFEIGGIVVWRVGLHPFAPQPPAQADARPTDDELWDQTLRERDNYCEWADKLANAIATYLGFEIGEHSNVNNPWREALEAIENAAQADARARLTDEQIDAIANDGHRNAAGGIYATSVHAFAHACIRAAHPGQPEPRAEVSPDDQRDGTRWRTLMKKGEPEVYVERTERRVIQRTPAVAFSSPNLTDNIGVNTTSEMWVKRYSIFAWWSRENEYRTFTEAVDAIAAGAIQ